MKKTRKLLIALLSFVLLVSMSLGLVACGPTISVELSESTLTLKERSNAYQLTAVVKENDVAVSNPALTWASSDSAVVTVDDGLVAVVGLGSADITVTYNGKSATCAVTVEASTFAISLDQTTLALKDRSNPVQLNATAVIDGATQSNPALVWASSNQEVVTVVDGLVTVVGLGSADVTCTFEGQTATCAVTVTETVFGIALDQTSLALKTISAPVTLVASATIDGDADANADIVWASSNEAVVTVENGVVTVVGAGDAVITATYQGKTAECAVNVVVPVYAIALDQASLALKDYSAPVTLVASATIDGEADADAEIVWTSSNEAVVTVENGVVTVVGLGDAVITATWMGKEASCAVNVSEPVYAVELQNTELALTTVETFGTIGFIRATRDGEAYSVEGASVVWSVADDSIAVVVNGGVGVRKVGETVVTCSYVAEDGTVIATGTCAIVVEAEWVTVSTGEEFVSLIQSKPCSYIKLAADIVINNEYIQENATAGYTGSTVLVYAGDASKIVTGIIDGQGYTVVINANTTGRPNGVLFGRLDGSIINTNFVIRTNNWGAGNTERMGALVGILEGSIEDCTLTLKSTVFGQTTWTLRFAFVCSMGENAVVRNVVINASESTSFLAGVAHENDIAAGKIYYSETSIVENFAIIREQAWTDGMVASVPVGMTVSGLYLFNSIDDMVNGAPAYAYDATAGAMVATTEVIDFAEVFGYELAPAIVTVRSGSYDASTGEAVYTDVDQKIFTVVMADETKAEGLVSAIFNMDTMEIVEEVVADANVGTVQIFLYIVDAEQNEVVSPLFNYIAEKDGIISISEDGTITVLGEGTVNVYVIYYGTVIATLKVTAIPKYVTVSTAQELYDAIQENKAIKLANDITIYNEAAAGLIEGATAVSGFKVYLADTFSGVIDGQGYTLTVNATENGRPWGGIFVNLNGTIKNLNVVSLRSDWGDGTNLKIGIVTNLNGTLENCSFTIRYHRFSSGQAWNIVWSFVENVGSSAVIKNCVFNATEGDGVSNILTNVASGATIENVAFVLLLRNYYSLVNNFNLGGGNYKNVYFFSTVPNLVNGAASSAVDNGAIVDVTEVIDLAAIFGANIVNNEVSLTIVQQEKVTDITINVPTFAPIAE